MPLVHPSAYYIHYLLSRYTVRDRSDGSIVAELGEMGLPVPQSTTTLDEFLDAFKAARVKLEPPPGFQPRAVRRSARTEAYLLKWGIEEAWSNNPAFLRAKSLLSGRAEVRRALCVALLGPLQRSTIAERIREHFGLSDLEMNPKVVLLFEHYFWNGKNLDVAMWREYLGPKWMAKYAYVDDYLTALTVPRDAAGGRVALECALRSGRLPPALMAYGLMKHATFGLFLEAARPAVKASVYSRAAAMAHMFATYRDITEEEERLAGGDSNLIEELRLISVSYDEVPQKTVHDLPRMIIATTPEETPT